MKNSVRLTHMNPSNAVDTKIWCLLAVLFMSASSAYGQKFEVTPLFGGTFGGTITLQQEGQNKHLANVHDSFSFGVAGGFRFDGDECEGCSLVEFRWMRQNTHLRFKDNASNAGFRPSFTLDHYMGDFTHEWSVSETHDRVKPFLTFSLGAARLATPAESRMRFAFGFGTGVKVFPNPRWGFRIQLEYLPTVMNAEVQNVVCAGGCIVMLNGGVMNQFVMSFGPIFRF